MVHLQSENNPLLSIDWLPEFFNMPWIHGLTGLLVLVFLSLLFHFILRKVVLFFFGSLIGTSKLGWWRTLYENKVPHRAAIMIPLLIMQIGLELVPGLSEDFAQLLQRITASCMILVFIRTFDAFLTTAHTIYLSLPMAGRRPIKSYVQLLKIFAYVIGVVFIVAQLANQSPWYFVSGLGAMMAILMLVFRDTLLSLVASIQLTNNDLIRVGDWIEMPQFSADGDVVDIALYTVKVQNWDRTVTVIPTHKFLEHSFRNWRNMFEGGGRRIMRAININMSTVRFLTEEEIERFSKFYLLKDYITSKTKELDEYNEQNGQDSAITVNTRRLTNLGTLRAYIIAYLKNHPNIRQDLTFLVRQLQPTPEGVPLEIYVFTNDTRWGVYENIQADIFDHILAAIPEFGLRVYQRPSGNDLGAIGDELAAGSEASGR